MAVAAALMTNTDYSSYSSQDYSLQKLQITMNLLVLSSSQTTADHTSSSRTSSKHTSSIKRKRVRTSS
jgi:hypothetical protein